MLRGRLWVKLRKPQAEHMFSESAPDIRHCQLRFGYSFQSIETCTAIRRMTDYGIGAGRVGVADISRSHERPRRGHRGRTPLDTVNGGRCGRSTIGIAAPFMSVYWLREQALVSANGPRCCFCLCRSRCLLRRDNGLDRASLDSKALFAQKPKRPTLHRGRLGSAFGYRDWDFDRFADCDGAGLCRADK
jgi:hypothetical protein